MLWLSVSAARYGRVFLVGNAAITILLVTVAAIPSFSPSWLPFQRPLTIDTDPENMLAEDEPVRVRHDALKHRIDIHDFVVVGVVNDTHEQGVFNARDLSNVIALTEKAKTLSYTLGSGENEHVERVVAQDIIAPSVIGKDDSSPFGQPEDNSNVLIAFRYGF
jgi:hypothetical protein